MEIIPVRVVLPTGQRVDEAYERSIMLADVRKDMGYNQDEVDLLINGEIIDESTRISDLKLHYCRDRVHIYLVEKKEEESNRNSKKVQTKQFQKAKKEEPKLRKPTSQQFLKIVLSDDFELEEKYNFRRYVSNYKRKVDLRGVEKKNIPEDINGYTSREQKFLATRTPLFHPCVQLGARCYTRKNMLENYNPAQDLKPRRVSPEQFVSFLFLIRVCVVLLIFDLDSYQLWILQLINLVAEVYFLIVKVKKIFKREEE